MKKCIMCKEPIHPKRLEILPNTLKCVSCSDVKVKSGITIMKGEGDNTYTETIIMEHDDFVKYKEMESKLNKTKFDEVFPDNKEIYNIEEDKDENEDALDFSNIGE